MSDFLDAGRSDVPPTALARLTVAEKISYGLGDAGGTIVTGLISNFLTFFYTDIFGLTPAIVGTLFVVLRIIDAISDPLIGIVADRTSTKVGQFRPFILWTAIPLGLIAFLTFSVPDLAYQWKIVYAVLTYFALSVLYSLNNVPYCALITKITANPLELVSCQSWRFALCGIAGFAVSVGLPVMVKYFGGDSQAQGYRWGVGILAFFAVVMFLCCFYGVKERVTARSQHTFNLKESLKSIRHNDQLLLTFVMSLLIISIFNTKGGAAMYFITYVLHGDAAYTSLFFGLATLGGIIGSILVQYLTRVFEIRRIYFWVNAVLGLAHFAVWFVPGNATTLWLILVFLCCLVLGFILPMHFTLVTFADAYGEWKSGRRSSGMNFAFNLFFVKLAWAVAGVIISVTLMAVSYQSGMENQTPSSIAGITLLSTIIPGCLHLLLATTVIFFRIDNQMVARMDKAAGR
ncbi:MFS transporter [Raoultella ornithinolytica]|uniref:MFS transporter n=1 Tax=Raoultella ornithinolytica TaxID=54291 RepID=UPI001399441A|nr:MFS transporter [Raoultella ornithinolytica]QHW69669.1 MFS transporter [Raoultella ornithinolytica]